MDLKTKYLLIEKLVNTEDDALLNQVKQILETHEGDFGINLVKERRKI